MDASASKSIMPLRYLGNTGIKVSVLSYGNMFIPSDEQEKKKTEEILHKAYESGINTFDNAEAYGFGASEKFFGDVFKKFNWPRESLVVTTKLFFGGMGVNDNGISRKHIQEGMNKSLKRLQLDCVDVVFCHRPDRFTPMEESVRAMNNLIANNKAYYWGTSQWAPAQIMDAYRVAERNGLIPPVVEQPQYNMLVRNRFESEYDYIFRELKYGSTVWSPLAGGLLTGRYNTGENLKGGRFDTQIPIMKKLFDQQFGPAVKDQTVAKLGKLANLAKELGYSQSQLALAWAAANQDVSTVLFGASKLDQLDSNLKSMELLGKWNHELEDKIEAILDNAPDPQIDARTFVACVPFPGRRAERLYSVK